MDKSSLKWNSLQVCGVLRHNPYIIQINFGLKFAWMRFLPLCAQFGNSLFLPMLPCLLSWCMISWFLLSVKREFRNYSSWLMTRRVCVTCGELELLTDICEFTTLFYIILRPKFSEWFVRVVYRQCIDSDLGLPFAIWSLEFAFHDQLLSSIVFKHSF